MPAFGEFTPGTVNVKVKTPSGIMSFDLTDFGPYPIWSTVQLSTTQSTDITYFQYGRGSPLPGGGGANGTVLDTNLENNAGQLGAADEMLIWAMRILFPSNITLANLQDIINKTYTALYISIQKPVSEGRIEFFPAGGGISGTTVVTSAEQWTNGRPDASAGRVFASPHYLAGITTFYARQQFVSALALSTTVKPCIVLDGLRRRPMG